MRYIIFAIVLLTTTLSNTAKAEMVKYSFDKTHTQIIFFVNHLGFSNSEGEFLKYEGSIKFDPENVEQSTVNIVIDSNSLDMDNETWNEHIKAGNFLNVENFPNIIFSSTSIKKTGDKTGELTGDFTLLGKTHPVTLNVTWNKSAKHPFTGKYTSGFSATGTIKRSDYGMTYALPAVGDEVKILLEVEAIKIEDE